MADMSMMTLIHNAFRRDFAYLAEQVAACPPGDLGRATALGHAFEFVALQLEHHHTGEDADLWPMAKAKLADEPEAVAVLDDMQAQHGVIDPALASVRGSFAALQAGRCAPAETAEAIRALSRAVEAHLDNEERAAVPIIERVLSEQDLAHFSRLQQKRGGGMRGGASFLPWLVDGMTPEQRAQALAHFPPPLRFLTQRVFPHSYRKAAPALMHR